MWTALSLHTVKIETFLFFDVLVAWRDKLARAYKFVILMSSEVKYIIFKMTLK